MLDEVKDIKSAYKFVKDGWAMVKKYGWYDKVVYPYSYPVKVTKILHDVADYRECTKGSQEYLNTLANGTAKILNHWEEVENEEDVVIRRIKDGKIRTVKRSVANWLIEENWVEEVMA